MICPEGQAPRLDLAVSAADVLAHVRDAVVAVGSVTVGAAEQRTIFRSIFEGQSRSRGHRRTSLLGAASEQGERQTQNGGTQQRAPVMIHGW